MILAIVTDDLFSQKEVLFNRLNELSSLKMIYHVGHTLEQEIKDYTHEKEITLCQLEANVTLNGADAFDKRFDQLVDQASTFLFLIEQPTPVLSAYQEKVRAAGKDIILIEMVTP